MWRWGERSNPSAVGDEPQPAILGQHPDAGVLQGHNACRAPFFSDFILKQNLDRFVEAICVN